MNGTDFCDRFFKWSHRIIVKQKHITFLLKSTKKLWLGMSFLVAGVFAAVSRADSCRQWRGLRRSSSFLRSSLHSYPYALHSSPRSCNYHVSCCSANTKKIAASNYSLSCSVGGKNGRYYYCGTETEKRQKNCRGDKCELLILKSRHFFILWKHLCTSVFQQRRRDFGGKNSRTLLRLLSTHKVMKVTLKKYIKNKQWA